MLGFGPGSFTAIVVAAEKPHIVNKLLLIDPLLTFQHYWSSEEGKAVLALAETNWDLFVETASHARLGWDRRESHDFAQLWRESILKEDWLRWVPELMELSIRPLLPKVQAETLVIYSTASRFRRKLASVAREITSDVPSARVMESQHLGSSWVANPETVRMVDEFFGIEPEPHVERTPTGMAVILFADVVGSTGVSERIGDAAFLERSRGLERRVRSVIGTNAGSAVEGRTLGDGVLATFTSASDAIAAAIKCAALGGEVGLALHLGLHAGDVIKDEDNVHGQAVGIAARVSALSAPDQVLVSSTVRELARSSTDVSFEDRGEHTLKGVSEPVRVYEVRWRE